MNRFFAPRPVVAEYEFLPHERPTMPGSPANPQHPGRRRIGYFAIGILIGITGGLGNALVTVNLNFAQGTLGLDTNQSAMLTAAYLMVLATAAPHLAGEPNGPFGTPDVAVSVALQLLAMIIVAGPATLVALRTWRAAPDAADPSA